MSEVPSEDSASTKIKFSYAFKDNSFKIPEVTRIFKMNNIPVLMKEEIANYTEKAFATLSKMDISEDNKQNLKAFGLWLMNRTV